MPGEQDEPLTPHQAHQRRYRARLMRRGAPEAIAVDLALAAASVAYIDVLEARVSSPADRLTIKILLRGTLDLLVAAGYDRAEATNVLRRRVTRQGRRDLERIVEISRVRKRMPQG
ncbi:hypothetical protein ACFSQT_14315 [Mesorhizobium calcicola]|uniref:Uncharacterized protein n=1 Tax=Mesorhizobium calcicola TaxID=1300310 RepID=A0ABW4WEE6_9HYPH